MQIDTGPFHGSATAGELSTRPAATALRMRSDAYAADTWAAYTQQIEQQGLPMAVTEHLQRTPGKLLRARMLHAATFVEQGSACEPCSISAGCAMELIQTASVLHDDLVDGAELRRGLPALGAAIGIRAAAMAGACLAGAGIACLADVAAHHQLALQYEPLRTLAEGQVLETLPQRGGSVQSCRARYLDVVLAKTAPLFRLAVLSGAQLGQALPATQQLLVQMADHLAVAYQVMDDIRDCEDNPRLGKAPGADILAGVLTWPLLDWVAADIDQTARLQALEGCRGNLQRSDDLRRRIVDSGTLQTSRQFVQHKLRAAQALLSELRQSVTTDFFAALFAEVMT